MMIIKKNEGVANLRPFWQVHATSTRSYFASGLRSEALFLVEIEGMKSVSVSELII
jgi:hypothetical protein